MALHPVRLPKSAAHLFRIVVLQKRLLKALANPVLDAESVDSAWLQHVWSNMDAEWVRKFCLGGKESVLHPLQTIAGANVAARQALFEEFYRQNQVAGMLAAGGNFTDLCELPGFSHELAASVKKVFTRCYKLLSNDSGRKWVGYQFRGDRCISNQSYKEDFCSSFPTCTVCPYCDGEIGTSELDHYYSKSKFPLLACSPWNLVPVCPSCNKVTAKGDSPAMTLGPPRSTNDWLHPFFRPASPDVQIRLSDTPPEFIPQLHSPDAAEQIRLSNHTDLIRSLSKRWTKRAAAYFDHFVMQVNRRLDAGLPFETIVAMSLEDHLASRGREASSMVKSAVCLAVLEQRTGYIEEFAAPNAPALD
jgi:5-methylcytosine-specific restriction endonuclease McrA